MLDFLIDHPVALVIIIFLLFRVLRGNKKQDPKGAMAAAQKPASRAEKKRRSRLVDMKAALEDAMREADRQFSSGDRAGSGDQSLPPAPEPPKIPARASASDPFAFHSVMNRGEEGRVGDTSRIDYDTTATDYDTRSDAFAFHSASGEPAEQEYHLTGFTGFQRAGGLSTDPVRVRAVGDDVAIPDEGDPLLLAMADPKLLRRAVILQEILERPVALRKR